MEYKIKEGKRDELVQLLAEIEFDHISNGDLIDILIFGCKGWNDMSDEDLIEHCEDKETFLERIG